VNDHDIWTLIDSLSANARTAIITIYAVVALFSIGMAAFRRGLVGFLSAAAVAALVLWGMKNIGLLEDIARGTLERSAAAAVHADTPPASLAGGSGPPGQPPPRATR
jgi:hypothetical protein